MVIFHSYVSLPEGNMGCLVEKSSPRQARLSHSAAVPVLSRLAESETSAAWMKTSLGHVTIKHRRKRRERCAKLVLW